MRYVGNEALSPQIQERIQNTFDQTIGLAEEGNRQEALLGCDFILRLDPLFEPARRLQERLNEGEGPVEIGDLTGGEAPQATAVAAPAPEISVPEASMDIGELIADVPDEAPLVADTPIEVPPIDELSLDVLAPQDDAPETMVTPPAEAAVEGTPAVADLSNRMAMLYEQRSFQDLMSLAMENQDRIGGDEDLRQMVDFARERLEAEPYVRNFLESAQTAREKGDLEGAKSHLEKARELDPSHPDLPGLEADLEATLRVEPPAAFEPPPLPEVPLEDMPPLIEPDAIGDISSEVDELFDSVESPAPEAAPAETTAVEPEPSTEEPTPVPSLDTEPAARLDSESEQRIDELLKEGQESFEDGQYQAAIDAWSRIFLIDIDHAEASRRIELARKLKAEVERQIEEAFHEGITRLESGEEKKAKQAFGKVLEMQPSHMGARDYLEKIESGVLSTAGAEPSELAPVAETAPDIETAAAGSALDADLTLEPTPVPSLPDDLAPTAPAPAPQPAPRKRSFALIGATVLILVLAVGWFVYANWDRFFPASTPGDDVTAAQPQTDPIERARELHEAGSTAMAINVLRRVPPGSDPYAEAQALIASWEAGGQTEEVPRDEPSEEVLAQRQELLTRAEQAVSQGENLLALDLIDQAHEISKLSTEEVAFRNRATNALELLRDERDLFDQGDWEYALPNLWRMRDADPANPDVARLMVNSYYNLGLRDLQRGDAKSALEKFEEAQGLADGDEDLDRLALFATAYTERPSDMLYRIFVKYQRFR